MYDVYAKDAVPKGQAPKGDWKYVRSKTFKANDKVDGQYGFTTRIDEQPDGNSIKISGIQHEKLDVNKYKSPLEGLRLIGVGGGGGGGDDDDEDSNFAQAYFTKWTTTYRHSIISAPTNAGYY